MFTYTRSDAMLSDCKRFRFCLTRSWGEGDHLNFILLNPSKADGTQDDATVRRCRGYAQAWGYAGINITNLFALRATDPQELYRADDPVGPKNDTAIRTVLHEAWTHEIVVAWGAHGGYQDRDRAVLKMLRCFTQYNPERLLCLGVTKDGFPRHPLRLRADLKPVPYTRR